MPSPSRPRYSEAEFQAQVIELATMLGWTHYHTADSRRSDVGFPDLVLVRHRIIYAELKTEGRLTAAQTGWIERLKAAGAEAYIWRPNQWLEIQAVLTDH